MLMYATFMPANGLLLLARASHDEKIKTSAALHLLYHRLFCIYQFIITTCRSTQRNGQPLFHLCSCWGLLVQWYDSRFGCERSRVRLPDRPFLTNMCNKRQNLSLILTDLKEEDLAENSVTVVCFHFLVLSYLFVCCCLFVFFFVFNLSVTIVRLRINSINLK